MTTRPSRLIYVVLSWGLGPAIALLAACGQRVTGAGEPVRAPSDKSPSLAAEPAPAANETAHTPVHEPTSNLIHNGDFSRGIAPWGAHKMGVPQGTPPQQVQWSEGSLCTTLPSGVQVVVGWPSGESTEPLRIVQGKRYALSVEASCSGPVAPKCVAKLGHRVPPYTGVAVLDLGLKPSPEVFQTDFVAQQTDELAGVAVECQLPDTAEDARLCLQRVGLVAL